MGWVATSKIERCRLGTIKIESCRIATGRVCEHRWFRLADGTRARSPQGFLLAAGDVIAVEVANVAAGAGFVSLGEVECLVDNGEISLVSLDTPDPAPGRALAILARDADATDYGYSSRGLPRRPALGDCP